MKRTTILILGAGPAGLSIGYELARRNLDFLILEKGKVAGESFAHYPQNIFFGPWVNNTLPGSRVAWNWLLRRSTQPAYTWYLQEYARRQQLPIQYGCRVEKVERDREGYLVTTNQGVHHCQLLVNCTGYFSTPNRPHYPGQDDSPIPTMHTSQYRHIDDLRRCLRRSSGRVLVVGAGLSAGEMVAELRKNGFEVALSHRGKLVFGPSPLTEALLSPFSWLAERAALALGLRLNSNPPMAGGETRRLIDSGEVPVFPAIEHFSGPFIRFVNGREERFDGVVWATGYRYTLGHLSAILPEGEVQLLEMESLVSPGLFFLGLDQQRSYRSRFLRGIRSDARRLAQILDERLALRLPPPPLEEKLFDLDALPDLVTAS
ncbi:MAG: NAD(P)-binding domain-containing protein [Candidatus Eremiobacteraeota bacterium]|nr:NAD(P)-binding domain-containing protein [Candidatus Eremiobacteraeota bacterium]